MGSIKDFVDHLKANVGKSGAALTAGQGPSAGPKGTTDKDTPGAQPPNSTPIIAVSAGSGSSFHVTGSGFAPNQNVFIRVADDQFQQVGFSTTSDGSGRIDATVAPKVLGPTTLHFSATDNRPVPPSVDITGSLWSNTVHIPFTPAPHDDDDDDNDDNDNDAKDQDDGSGGGTEETPNSGSDDSTSGDSGGDNSGSNDSPGEERDSDEDD